MTQIETDYLVVGAGASAMAFVDALVADSDVDVVLVDRRHAAGGHWLDSYPFVRLHQPSAYYGVNSLALGQDRIDTEGINQGFYERATGTELCAYYEEALARLVAAGRVRFFGNTEYQGADSDGHVLTSRLDGRRTHVQARRRVVDATYIESIVPFTHDPNYKVASGVRLIPPNGIVHLQESASRFTIVGGGKTAMDTVFWLLEQGVDPDSIRWIRPRESWLVDRATTQPLELVAAMAEYQSRTIEGVATAKSGLDLALHLEAHGMMHRIDDSVDAPIFRGATIARGELEALRRVEDVVRLGHVRAIDHGEVQLAEGALSAAPDTVYVDCTAQGLATSVLRPIFAGDAMTIQFATLGVAPWSAAILGFVESLEIDDVERNRLCPPVPRTGLIADQLWLFQVGFGAEGVRRTSTEIAAWSQRARLNPTRAMPEHMGDKDVQESMARTGRYLEAAMTNLAAHAR